VAGQEKENRVCMDIDGVDEDVVEGLLDVMRNSGMPHWLGS
jgi:hypothetical protein